MNQSFMKKDSSLNLGCDCLCCRKCDLYSQPIEIVAEIFALVKTEKCAVCGGGLTIRKKKFDRQILIFIPKEHREKGMPKELEKMMEEEKKE